MGRQNRDSTTATQPELNCSFCNRNFENKKQAARHVRYCRTKAKDGVSTRRRSCLACIKAKTRCEMTLPTCSRCINKGIQCLYKPLGVSSTTEVQSVPADEPLSEARQEEGTLAHDGFLEQAVPNSSSTTSRREISLCEPRRLSFGNNFDYTLSTNTSPAASNLNIPTFSNEVQDFDSITWNVPFDTYLLPQIYHFKDRVVLGNFYNIDVPIPGVDLDTKTILEKRDVRAGPQGSALGRAYCMSTLRSYPKMLCSDDGTLPPFIHAQARPRERSQVVNSKGLDLSEPLEICRSIMRMYMAKTSGNLPFIWRTIGAESQRIEDNYRTSDTWSILASVQAMTIYLILGLLDDNNEYVVDVHILRSMCNTTRRIAEKLHPIGNLCYEELPQDQLPTWEDWALSECRRRTAMVLVILVHLFNLEHGSCLPPCGGFANLPLPCSKKMWQAKDEETWEKEYRKEYMQNTGEGLKRVPTYKDLLPDLQEGGIGGGDKTMGWLSEWFLGMDEVGTLVTMAVSTL